MRQRAQHVGCGQALHRIARRFDTSLRQSFQGQAPVTIHNNIDATRPPLKFNFIQKSVLGEGVHAADPETILGCGLSRGNRPTNSHGVQRCRPDMGQNIGCEYGRLCDCLEYAAVDDARLSQEEKLLYDAGDTTYLPKRFPYYQPNLPGKASCLVPFYMKSRHPIYECNERCNCGPGCKTRVVQKGRKVPLEIFKTPNRGWGESILTDFDTMGLFLTSQQD